METGILKTEKLSVTYEGAAKPAIADINISLASGERVALLGLNGSGKTTLLKAIAGLLPFMGNITLNGITSSDRTIGLIRSHLGFVFAKPEDQILLPKVAEDVAFGLRNRGTDKATAREAAIERLDSLGIGHLAEAQVYGLSHGMLQRVALAGAMIAKPSLLLLDEPTSDLDPIARGYLTTTLVGLNAAILMATHDTDFAQRTCGRFVVIHEGHIVADHSDPERLDRWWESIER